MTDSRWVALDRISRIIPDDRRNAPCGKWVMVKDWPGLHAQVTLNAGGYFRGKPLSDSKVLDEAIRWNKRRYRYKVRT
jgi:hypothetical protein